MTKSDLKTGMIAKTRDGSEHTVFIDTIPIMCNYCDKIETSFIVNRSKNIWDSLNNYNNDLTHIEFEDLDIVEIYIPLHPYSFQDVEFQREKRRLIWKREEDIKEVTMKDIENKFGCKVKIVKE